MKKNQLVELLNQMTLEEKIAQLVQLTPDFFSERGEITGPMQEWNLTSEKLFQIGSILGTHTAEQVYQIQKNYLAHNRLKIPLIFMADVIHGYETIFPIPLALAASFNSQLVSDVAHFSAKEATAAGIHVTFSPMADYVKDPRWGRVLESNGEDPVLSEALTRAYVQGYQGPINSLATDTTRLAACVKHFVGYGGAEGGRDYNTVDFSDLEMYQNYLPSFRGAIQEGAQLVMTAFNTIRGVPTSANRKLLQEVLRNELQFGGVLISDWGAVMELIAHRVVSDSKEAAKLAFHAGVDIEMMSDCYLNNLEQLLDNSAEIPQLDEAVLRILTLKNNLGLFENPYRGLANDTTVHFDHREMELASEEAARQTFVLLKNEDQLLPLNSRQKIALIGPKADSQDILGAWSWIGDPKKAVSLAKALEQQVEMTLLPFTDGKPISDQEIAQACAVAKNQDVVILAVGETSDEAGEAASLADIRLSRGQESLIHAVSQVNDKVILVIFSGRPLVLTDVVKNAKAVLQVWFPGSRGGNAITSVLLGESAPTGKLPISFPRSVGQLPLSYRQLSTGRPRTVENSNQKYISRYLDEENTPLYAFGHGLTYGSLIVTNSHLDQFEITRDGALKVSVQLTNPSEFDCCETVQLYLQDQVAEVALPLLELKQWQKVFLVAGEEKTISFTLTEKDLCYVHSNLKSSSDYGSFEVYVGFSSEETTVVGSFRLVEK